MIRCFLSKPLYRDCLIPHWPSPRLLRSTKACFWWG